MRRFIISEADAGFTSHDGLGLIGQALERYTDLASDAAGVASLRSDAMPHRDVLASYFALLRLGKNDFEAITGFLQDAFFHEAAGREAGSLREELGIPGLVDTIISGFVSGLDTAEVDKGRHARNLGCIQEHRRPIDIDGPVQTQIGAHLTSHMRDAGQVKHAIDAAVNVSWQHGLL